MKKSYLPINTMPYFESRFMIMYLSFYEGRKTPIIEIENRNSDELLGLISYRPGWRKFVFFPYGSMVFDSECLNDIVKCINKVQEDYKRGNYTEVENS
jgi:hypothetical protein